MPRTATDRNLLFGILALQMDFIGRDALISGMHAWVLDKNKSLGQVLLEQNILTSDTHTLLEALVQKHLSLHGNDAEKSLAAVSSVGSIRKDLENITDPDVQASLVHVSAARAKDDDPYATASVGIPTSVGTRFRILRPHAKGGLGQVSVALDEELHREVALKEIQDRHADDEESRSRFMLEAEITGGLEHPGIVPVYGLGTYADGRPYYAMRFIRGDSLQDAIKRYHQSEPKASAIGERTLELRKLLGRFIDVCQAIQYAHDRGVLHRDLKPGNIMLGKYGETLVVDWGLAKSLDKPGSTPSSATLIEEPKLRPWSASGSAETVAGTAVGTPAYMSPEQAAGRLELLGPASDVYSLGATLYALLTGKPAVEGTEVAAVLTRVQRGDFPRPRQRQPNVNAALEAICLKAMALNPADRYASPRTLADDLERWLGDEPVSAMPEPLTVKIGRWMRRHKPLVSGTAAALLVGVIALSAGAVWYSSQQAEAARKQAVAEEKVRQGLEQAQQTRDELHHILKQPGGVHTLLNQPARWQAQIKSARADWQRANDHAETAADPRWTSELKTLDGKLTRDQADYELALRFERIRLDRIKNHDVKESCERATEEYLAAFAEAGLSPVPGRQKEVAHMIAESAIKDQLVAALDGWASVNPNLCSSILEVARGADPDPWRDQVRDPTKWSSGQGMVKVAEEAIKDREFLARLSPQILQFIAASLPNGKTQETWLRRAQALHPGDFYLNLLLAASLQENDKALEATGFCRVATTIRPNTPIAWAMLGGLLTIQNDLPAAIDAYNKAVAIDPKYALAWVNLGMALRNEPVATDAFNKALALDHNDTIIWLMLGGQMRARNDLPAAITAYNKVLAINPNDARAWLALGDTMRDKKDLPAAMTAYNKVLAINPKNARAWLGLGNTLRDNKDLSAAITAYKKALAIDDQDAYVYFYLGNALRSQKELPAAISAYKKALASGPKLDFECFMLGHALQELNELPAAIAAYQKTLAINPKMAMAWNNLGAALRNQKDLPAATDAYKKALATDSKLAMAWVGLGDCLRDQKDFRAAAHAYKKSLAIDPKNAFAWQSLGYTQATQKDLSAAVDAFKRALSIDPHNAHVWYNLGAALREEKDLPAAIDAYKKALAIDSKDALAWTNLGSALHGTNDLPAAIDAYNKSLTINPNDALTWRNLGLAQQIQKDLPAAIDAFKKAIELEPDLAEAYCNLGQALRDQGDLVTSLKALEEGHRLGSLRKVWRYPSATWVKECQELLALEKKLAGVLQEKDTASVPINLALADLCQRYKKRYHDATQLYARAFAAEPSVADELSKLHRYNAACCASLAAAGKGVDADKLDAKVQARLRNQAFDWLKADLAAYAKLLDKDPVRTHDQMQHWQRETDLTGLCDEKELAKLPADGRAALQKLWDDVDRLAKKARASYTQTEHKGQLGGKEREQSYSLKITAGKTYTIDMESPQFDTYLRLEDEKGKIVAENNGISPTNRNSRIVFTAAKDGAYRIVATAFEQRGVGSYDLLIREFEKK